MTSIAQENTTVPSEPKAAGQTTTDTAAGRSENVSPSLEGLPPAWQTAVQRTEELRAKFKDHQTITAEQLTEARADLELLSTELTHLREAVSKVAAAVDDARHVVLAHEHPIRVLKENEVALVFKNRSLVVQEKPNLDISSSAVKAFFSNGEVVRKEKQQFDDTEVIKEFSELMGKEAKIFTEQVVKHYKDSSTPLGGGENCPTCRLGILKNLLKHLKQMVKDAKMLV